MKSFLVVILIATMYGCVTEAEPLPDKVRASLVSASEPEPEPVLDYDMCFHVTDAVYKAFPDIDNCLEQVGLAWGIEIVVDDDCEWSVDIRTFSDSDSGARDIENYAEEIIARVEMSRNGINIVISKLWVDKRQIVDMHTDDCNDAGARITLRNVLLHEIGHTLVFDHDHELGFMSEESTCDWLEPSASMQKMAQMNPFWESI